MLRYFLLFVVLAVSSNVDARSTGAPREICVTLSPKHGQAIPQPDSTNPFDVFTENTVHVASGKETILVNITSKQNMPILAFRGFLLQARYAKNPDQIVDGNFEPSDLKKTQTYTCKLSADFKNNNTWTHSINEPKESVMAMWTPPDGFTEDIIFTGTIVKDKATYWENFASKPVTIDSTVNADKHSESETDAKTLKGTVLSNDLDQSDSTEASTTESSAAAAAGSSKASSGGVASTTNWFSLSVVIISLIVA